MFVKGLPSIPFREIQNMLEGLLFLIKTGGLRVLTSPAGSCISKNQRLGAAGEGQQKKYMYCGNPIWHVKNGAKNKLCMLHLVAGKKL